MGDADGDGQYELYVKWDAASADNSHNGQTDNVIIDCYTLAGELLWRIDLGPNIRAGAHYTQFMVYDFDLDGRAELICKTAAGSRDAAGRYVSAAATDPQIRAVCDTAHYANDLGHVLEGPELLTVFDGQGLARHTVWYRPNRAGGMGPADYPTDKDVWGDLRGNRSERYLACVAWLGGPKQRPSAVMCRGYYTRAYLWAVDYDGNRLATRWLHASVDDSTTVVTDSVGHDTTRHYHSNTSGKGTHCTAYADGNHNLSVADVDFDGRDEVLYGACAIDDEGSLLYATGYGHGDAMHLSDLCPDRPGYELYTVHEEAVEPYGYDLHDALTGEVLHHRPMTDDTGRGMAANLLTDTRGAVFAYVGDKDMRDCPTGDSVVVQCPRGTRHLNYRIYWDGDPYDELFDGVFSKDTRRSAPAVFKWVDGRMRELGVGDKRLSELGAPASNNYTKANPCLQADLFGDWREELVMASQDDPSVLYIYSSQEPTPYRWPTLMHDHVYRLGIAWQNTAYNQPPHLGYYLPDYMK